MSLKDISETITWGGRAVVGVMVFQIFSTINADHEKIANHETRITVLEQKTPARRELSYFHCEAILPHEIKITKEEE
jgi:hypothetical protein